MIEFEMGSGNVFADLDLPDADRLLEEARAKAVDEPTPSRTVQVTLFIEVQGEAAKDQLTAERAVAQVVNLNLKDWRCDFQFLKTHVWDSCLIIKWRLRDWWFYKPEKTK